MIDQKIWDELAESDAAAAGLTANRPVSEAGGEVRIPSEPMDLSFRMDELPLWVGEGAPEPAKARSEVADSGIPDLKAQLGDVAAAWREAVPAERGTADDLRAVLEADVQALQVRWQSVAALPYGGEAPVGTRAHGAAQQQADAVNAALRGADRHAPALSGVPEWQQIRTVREAVDRLWRTLATRAGEHADRLFRDHRISDFLRQVSIRACETIARLAQLAADRLLRGRTALPSAEALLALGNAAGTYSTFARSHGSLPTAGALLALGSDLGRDTSPAQTGTEVDVPGLVALGRALRKPGPGWEVSSAAARLRSGGAGQVRRSTPAGEQAAHPRTASVAQSGRKPRQR
ncbi:hypothetical protein [Streptomyces rubellomurinus]|nr:hypothetical protein [Streptomyces rubellomurinus]